MKVTGKIYTSGDEGSVLFGWGIDGSMKIDIGVILENLLENQVSLKSDKIKG